MIQPGPNRRTTTGRCSWCDVRYEWPAGPSRRLRRAWCPDCGGKLQATTRTARCTVERRRRPTFASSHIVADSQARFPGQARDRKWSRVAPVWVAWTMHGDCKHGHRDPGKEVLEHWTLCGVRTRRSLVQEGQEFNPRDPAACDNCTKVLEARP